MPRLLAVLSNATKRPSNEIVGRRQFALASEPLELTLARSVTPVCRSCTKMSVELFVSPATRLLAPLANATYRPSPEIAGWPDPELPGTPLESTLTISVDPVAQSCTKTSSNGPSLGVKFVDM